MLPVRRRPVLRAAHLRACRPQAAVGDVDDEGDGDAVCEGEGEREGEGDFDGRGEEGVEREGEGEVAAVRDGADWTGVDT